MIMFSNGHSSFFKSVFLFGVTYLLCEEFPLTFTDFVLIWVNYFNVYLKVPLFYLLLFPIKVYEKVIKCDQ